MQISCKSLSSPVCAGSFFLTLALVAFSPPDGHRAILSANASTSRLSSAVEPYARFTHPYCSAVFIYIIDGQQILKSSSRSDKMRKILRAAVPMKKTIGNFESPETGPRDYKPHVALDEKFIACSRCKTVDLANENSGKNLQQMHCLDVKAQQLCRV